MSSVFGHLILSNQYFLICICIGHHDGDMRVVSFDNDEGVRGYVQVYKNQEWNPVSADTWDTLGAYVACRQFGYKSGKTISDYQHDYDNGKLVLTNFTKIFKNPATCRHKRA